MQQAACSASPAHRARLPERGARRHRLGVRRKPFGRLYANPFGRGQSADLSKCF
ncbi:hypothetical protein P4H65_19055 [Paenibacillus chitinolyticus]|uniref:hypothetical protein n=1 Tax=Paenibacillus chitinolyticus TaxID=79263 RepID=UPI002DB6EF2A|nr:hypothetical protein [Paenibacillus chitinolyticus]MEC0247897.1 hypothetical protein [Paenibacillus chitinolyticus]